MKRLLSLLVCIVLCVVLAAPVFADVLWVPENDFLHSHESECEYVDRGFSVKNYGLSAQELLERQYANCGYVVNSPKGYTWVYEDPESGKALAQALNGTVFAVAWTYQGQWGVVEFHLSDDVAISGYGHDQTGWIKLEDCYAYYNADTFRNEHFKQLKYDQEAVEAFIESLEMDQALQFYSYPGSGEITSQLSVRSEDALNEIKNTFDPDMMFQDENGLWWGHVGKYFGVRRDWLCLSDPTNANLPDMHRAAPTIYPAKKSDLSPEEASPSPKTGEQTRNLTIAGVLVAAVAAVSGVLIARLKKKTA